ncbi:MAG: TonB-dependent receptor [Proteobacteria bacterium SG_bin5]|nr:TonB-dependent receptor [Sphingomonas sp.]OQW43027.1 MAG: TonB-dependent receptor [Proteobacteria bacterium SG_bin5]
MSRSFELASLLLVSSALVSPSVARAQNTPTPGQSGPATPAPAPGQADPAQPGDQPADPAQQAGDAGAEQMPEVSVPGGEVVVTGRRGRTNVLRSSTQAVSLLSSEDIARTGEGDIAGALSRVTGLSVVGNGFVYVRGLGDRYSLALLNGLPLPSPEPLRRVVPLDIFPTNVIASSLVQKTYSVNFPAEYGGGVINLTTKSVPKEGFFNIDAGIGGDTVTTGQLGYTYYGTESDWTGFGNGGRLPPPALQNYFTGGTRLSQLPRAQNIEIAAQLINGRNAVVQRNGALPPNWSLGFSAGKSWDIGDTTLGLIAAFGYSNKWRTRDNTQQLASSADLSQFAENFRRVITDNRLVVDGLIGANLEFGQQKLRWTTLYIRDTLKQARLGEGTRPAQQQSLVFRDQDTAWFERQLIDTQVVGEFKIADAWRVDLRGSFANSRRNAPEELNFEYSRNINNPIVDFRNIFTNQLNNQNSSATISYSQLRENLYAAGIDITYKPQDNVSASFGYSFQDTGRTTERRDLRFNGLTLPEGVGVLRPDLLLSPAPVRAFGIFLEDQTEGGNALFGAGLTVHASYGRLQLDLFDKLSLDVGFRYQNGSQFTRAIPIFRDTAGVGIPQTRIDRDYWLPAVTLTYKLNPEMQFRISGSKTIARPQFRELIFQPYYDPEYNRNYRGNPLINDSQLYNAEARYEWYFARDQRFTLAGFYKRIENPIEPFVSLISDNDYVVSFANAPRAELYGFEVETQKYFDLDGVFGNSKFFADRRMIVIANYTYTQSQIQVGPNDPAQVFPLAGVTRANQLFRNGVPLTGQSDHLANLEIGFEQKNGLSQQTLLFNYASRRVTQRGGPNQPDVFETPGIRLDFVARQGIKFAGVQTELKFEARNITGTIFRELQQVGANRIFFNRYNQGTLLNLSLGVQF